MTFISYSESQVAYSMWLDKLLKGFVASNPASIPFDQQLGATGYFLTMKFNAARMAATRRLHGIGTRDATLEFQVFDKFYRSVVDELRAIDDTLPLAIVGIDFNGSKFATTMPIRPTDLHIHAVMVFTPKQADRAKELMSGFRLKMRAIQLHYISRLLADPYSAKKAAGGKGLTYALKAHIKSTSSPTVSNLLHIYGNGRGFTYYSKDLRMRGLVPSLRRYQNQLRNSDPDLHEWETAGSADFDE